MQDRHKSVLLQEWLSFLEGRSVRTYVDGTLGAGGHALGVLQEHPEIEKLIGIDQDTSALALAKKTLEPFTDKCRFLHGNFGDMGTLLKPFAPVDGIFLDIGVSSMQLDEAGRGFSFMHDGPLDMRMNRDNPLTASDIVNTYSEQDLGRIFRVYGEERQWRRAAHGIVEAREERPFTTTLQLANVLKKVLITLKHKHIHPATLVFQALRIAVNAELEVLEKALPAAIEALAPGGLLAVITFHSLEDRIVKQFFRDEASDKVSTSGIGGMFLDKEPVVRSLTRKPATASPEEVAENPRSRSAKLRVVEKL